MRTTMVIPSYWGRESTQGTKRTDAVYDHPTPLDKEGTLGRTIQSLEILEDRDFELVVIAAATAEDIEGKVEEKVRSIISSATSDIPIHLFSHSQLRQIHEVLKMGGREEFNELLQLGGYSNIRNLCLFLPHLLGSDTALLIDDDEVFEDPTFVKKAHEFIGQIQEGVFIGAVAGYYLQPDGDWRVKSGDEPWAVHWDKMEMMNEAFERFIGTEPRLKETPFVFGGNMVVHRDVFTRIPFDPNVTRGEDIDFLINMKMFGYRFFLDNTLSIKHLPPPKTHPVWKRLREDILRFVRERDKLRDQEPLEGMVHISAGDLDPYPGAFLKDDLEEKIEKASTILADILRSEGKEDDALEAMRNIQIAREEAAAEVNTFRRLLQIQKGWQEMMEFTGREDIRENLSRILVSQ